MKHQHILACDKASFGIDGLDGFIAMSPKTMFEQIGKSLFIGRREELEKDERFGQILPYIVLYKRRLYQHPSIFVYQRTKNVGEKRLAGDLSIGVGGHVDLADVVSSKDSVIDVVATIAGALRRELNEEVGFKRVDGGDIFLTGERRDRASFDGFCNLLPGALLPRFVGLINDTSNAVGRVHFGFVFAVCVPEEYEPYCIEEELSTVGMVQVELAARTSSVGFENWSRLILDAKDSIPFKNAFE